MTKWLSCALACIKLRRDAAERSFSRRRRRRKIRKRAANSSGGLAGEASMKNKTQEGVVLFMEPRRSSEQLPLHPGRFGDCRGCDDGRASNQPQFRPRPVGSLHFSFSRAFTRGCGGLGQLPRVSCRVRRRGTQKQLRHLLGVGIDCGRSLGTL